MGTVAPESESTTFTSTWAIGVPMVLPLSSTESDGLVIDAIGEHSV